MHKIVIDANVFVSAIFGGISGKTVIHAFKFNVFVTKNIEKELLELSYKLSNKLSILNLIKYRKLINVILANTKRARAINKIDICRDKKDNAYLDACLACNADFLITGDKDLLSLSKTELVSANLENLKIVTPKIFLKEQI
jgi:putative PIN family toxin of toxin-antitoxin system